MLNMRIASVLLFGCFAAAKVLATDNAAATALAAWQDFRAEPAARLDRAGPFLDFIRDNGQVHIVLNEHLLGWMYEPIADARKAVLYAGFLGANMAAQLEQGTAGSNDYAAMRGALEAYESLRREDASFRHPLFERLLAARAENRLESLVRSIAAGEDPATQ